MALEVGHGLGGIEGRRGIADAPARHGIGLGHAVDDDGALLDLGAERSDGDVLRAVVDQEFVNLVRDDGKILFDRQIANRLQLLAGEHESVGVVGGIDDDGAGLVRHRRAEIVDGGLEVVFLPALHDHRHAARHPHDFGIADPVGAGDDDLVALLQQRLEGVEQRMLRAVGYHDLLGHVIQSVVPLELIADGLPKLRHTGRGGIAGLSQIQRILGRLADVLRGVEIRFARAEADHVDALLLHFLRLCVNRKCQRARHALTTLGNPHD